MHVSEKTTHLVSMSIECITSIKMNVKYAVTHQFTVISKAFLAEPVLHSSKEVLNEKNINKRRIQCMSNS